MNTRANVGDGTGTAQRTRADRMGRGGGGGGGGATRKRVAAEEGLEAWKDFVIGVNNPASGKAGIGGVGGSRGSLCLCPGSLWQEPGALGRCAALPAQDRLSFYASSLKFVVARYGVMFFASFSFLRALV